MDFDVVNDTITPTTNTYLTINGAGGVSLPGGTTGSRPTGVNGIMRYNTTTGLIEGYVSGAWSTVSTSTIANYVIGDILYASSTTALSSLADVATGNALISGGVGVAPSWGKIGLTTHISGTLAVGNGGTGVITTPTNTVSY